MEQQLKTTAGILFIWLWIIWLFYFIALSADSFIRQHNADTILDIQNECVEKGGTLIDQTCFDLSIIIPLQNDSPTK